LYNLSRHVDAAEDIPALFSDRNLQGAHLGNPDILVQVFWNGPGVAAVEAIGRALRQRFPLAVIVGASSGGNICEGSLAPKGAVVSVTCFAQARLQAFVYDIEAGKEA
jgi:hypothetical protein